MYEEKSQYVLFCEARGISNEEKRFCLSSFRIALTFNHWFFVHEDTEMQIEPEKII